MNKNDQEFVIQKIRSQYIQKADSQLDTLKALDAKVKGPVNAFAYTFGGISALVMGSGMSLVMTDLGTTLGMNDAMIPGILIGLVGMAMALINYPIYKKRLSRRQSKYASQIIALSDQLLEK